MLSKSTLPLIVSFNVALEQLGTIFVYTLPLRLNNPKTMVFPPAPRPLFPRVRRAPKKLSSTSISPEKGDSSSHSLAIHSLTNFKFRLTVLRFKPLSFAIFVASKSSEKYLIIYLNFLVEIRDLFKTVFAPVMTVY